MLSYRHSYHAGNFADVLKHIVLLECLEHFNKKDAPFDYIDTHSGAGLYDLRSANANKTAEYKEGIAKLKRVDFSELTAYFDVIEGLNQQQGINNKTLAFYPGSPAIAHHYVTRDDRQKDKAWLFELHSSDFRILSESMATGSKALARKIRIKQEDGLKALLALVPPVSRRALVLIDPSYEIKADYYEVVEAVIKAHKKFSSGTYAIWYPVVERKRVDAMWRKLKTAGIKNIHQYELGLAEDSLERGMTSAGMLLINPPWTLKAKLDKLLPKLVKQLDRGDGKAFSMCQILVEE
ncbi:MAG: 23S rRNA (adenine(2030)-N(6))-methyltransferase RlmJ [Oleispira sp.]|nr:23S rRNA (adenine(2030)-N(6))-methyltransferase RlmJ [Oleispira sp.]